MLFGLLSFFQAVEFLPLFRLCRSSFRGENVKVALLGLIVLGINKRIVISVFGVARCSFGQGSANVFD